jgi:hypothetical protein
MPAQQLSGKDVQDLAGTINLIQQTIAAIENLKQVLQAVENLKRLDDDALTEENRNLIRAVTDGDKNTILRLQTITGTLEDAAVEMAMLVDPPIDTVSHQVQFIIVWNASATPSWTLLHFKGPGPATGTLASLTKTKTHTLNLVMGPPSSVDSQGALAALQISTALFNAGARVPSGAQ